MKRKKEVSKLARGKNLSSKLHLVILISLFILLPLILAPASYEQYTNTTFAFYNQTESSNLGERLSASVLSMDFNSNGESFPNLVYQNSSLYEQGTYIKDGSIYNNFGTSSGLTTQYWWNGNTNGTGKINGSLQFDGSNDYVSIPDSNSINISNNSISVSSWINENQDSDKLLYFISKKGATGGYSSFTYINYPYFSIVNSTGGTCAAYKYSKLGVKSWRHIVGTYNGSVISLYVDGVLWHNASCPETFVFSPTTTSLSIGSNNAAANSYFNGSIDDVIIWSRALNSSEISTIYSEGLAGRTVDNTTMNYQVGHWKLDELNGTRAVDMFSTNNGTLTNYPTATGISPVWNATGGVGGSGAYVFDGVNDYISLGKDIIGTDSVTICSWVNPLGSGGGNLGRILDNKGSSGVMLYISGSQNVYFASAGSSTTISTSSSSVPFNKWTFVCALRNIYNTSAIYIDGILNVSGNTGTPVVGDNVIIGNRLAGDRAFNGSIDNVQIFNRALSASEVLALYNGTSANRTIKYSTKQGDFKSGVFYNSSTSTYWNVNLSIADTNSPASGIVNNKNEINLSNPNLVSYWALDGNYRDAKGMNNGTCTSTTCPNNASGLSSNAMRFDGVDDYVSVTNNINVSNQITISLWAKPNLLNQNDFAGIISKGSAVSNGNFAFGIYDMGANQDEYYFRTNNGTAFSDTTSSKVIGLFGDTNWHHISWIINGTNNSVYKDSVLLKSFTGVQVNDINRVTYIGSLITTASYVFNGSISDVAVYNTSLSASQIQQLYKSGLSKKANTNVTIQTRTANNYNVSDPSLVAFWGLNENNNVTAIDELGRNNGTYLNGAKSNASSGVVGSGGYFDGSDDYVNYTNSASLNITGNITLTAWIKTNTLSVFQGIIDSSTTDGASYQMYLRTTAGAHLGFNQNIAGMYYRGTCGTLETNKWYFLTGTISGTSVTMYINGQNCSATLTSAAIARDYNKFTIGYVPMLTNDWFNGSIDEVRIYNRSLSADEVMNLYQLGSYHISNWSSWSTASLVSDNTGTISSSAGKFMQFKANLNTNDTDVSPYVLNYSVGILADSSGPFINISYPGLNNNYSYQPDSLNFTLSDDSAVYGCWYSNDSGITNTSVDLSCSNLTSLVSIEGVNTWTLYSNDTLGYKSLNTTTFMVDLTNPSLSILTPADSIKSNATSLNLTAFLSDNVGLKNSTLKVYTIIGTLYNTSYFTFNSGITSETIGSFVNFTDGNYLWSYEVYDWSGRRNNTENRTLTIDQTPPRITNLTYSPNTTGDVDPNTMITINAAVTDALTGIDSVFLYYHNGTEWSNQEMSFISGNTYSTNITLSAVEANYTYYIWSNDTTGNANTSSNASFESSWDCSWNITPTNLGQKYGWTQNKLIGDITIINTGDPEYSIDGCSITFRLTHNLDRDRIYFNGYKKDKFYDVNAETNYTVQVNATFKEEQYSDPLSISIYDYNLISSTEFLQSNATLVSTSGPYLDPEVEPSSSNLSSRQFSDRWYELELKAQEFTLNSSINNGLGDNTENYTAYNVSLFWDIPSIFLVSTADAYHIATDILIATDTVSIVMDSATATVEFFYSNISDGLNQEKHGSLIYLDLNSTNLPSITAGSYYLDLTSYGYNYTGNYIQDLSDSDYEFTDQLRIDLVCQDASDTSHDSVCVSDCKITDPDCWVCGNSYKDTNESCDAGISGNATCSVNCQIITSSGQYCGDGSCNNGESCSSCSQDCGDCSPSGGGGGGGGGAGLISSPKQATITQAQVDNLFQTSAYYELVRGEENIFYLTVENTFDGKMENVLIDVSGFLSQYISVYPDTPKTILPGSSMNYSITIEAPEYFTEGSYQLNFNIKGIINKTRKLQNITFVQLVNINEKRNVELMIVPISNLETREYINSSLKLIEKMNLSKFNILKSSQLLSRAYLLLEQKKYSEIIAIYDQIEKEYNDAVSFVEIRKDVNEGISKALYDGLEVKKTQRLLLLSSAAFDRGDYATALQRINDAKITLTLETVGKINWLVYFKHNWKMILSTFFAIDLIVYIAYLILKYLSLTQRIKTLNVEKDIILSLIKEVQRECFEHAKISIEQYMESMLQYESKMNSIVNRIIELETKKAYMLKFFTPEKQRLLNEKERIIDLIKDMQEMYISTNQIETHLYENRMKGYTERLAEIEERLVNIDVEKALRKH